MSGVQLSVVVPVYNESKVVEELVARCMKSAQQAVAAGTGSFELILVDDGSQDETPRKVRGLAADPRLHCLRLDRNTGQYRATLSGLNAATGRWIVVLDGDMQDPPELIPELFTAAGADERVGCVFAVKQARKEAAWFRIGQFVFHFVQSTLGGVSPPRGAGSCCIMSREVARGVVSVSLRHANLAAVAARVLHRMSARHSTLLYEKGRRYDQISRVGCWGLVREALGSFLVSGALWRLAALISGMSLVAAAILASAGLAGCGVGFGALAVLGAIRMRRRLAGIEPRRDGG
jgi:glycosyltransferase involved in cell wall biosynthesis